MKKLLALAAMATMLMAIAASAQTAPVDPDPDQMGIYFDTAGTVFCDPGLMPNQQINIYVMITNPTWPQVAAWECKVIWDQMGGGFYGNWTLANGGLNVGDLSDPNNLLFAVGVGGNPIPAAPAMILATWSGFYAYGSGSVFYLQHYPGTQSFPDDLLPGYAPDENNLIPCGISSGDENLPVASFGVACDMVANEDMTWSGVKDLYR